MPKIITVTANTAADYFIEINDLSAGDNLIADSSEEYACGKGVNVAKALESLNCNVLALGFVGRLSSNLFNEIGSNLVTTDFSYIDGKTRTNITLYDSSNSTETHIRTTGFSVTHADCNQLLDKIAGYIRIDDIVVLSGSLPAGAPPDWYKTLIEMCHKKSAIAFLDSSGDSLIRSLKSRPYLSKPNQRELEEVVGRKLSSVQDIIDAASTITEQGVQRVVVSRGEKGVVVVTEKQSFSAQINGPLANTSSSIGCGDALVAGLSYGMLQGFGLVEQIKFAVACATANLYSREPGKFDKNRIPEIIRQIEIRSL